MNKETMMNEACISTPPASVGSYDEYVGLFVDAVQLSAVEFVELRTHWLGDCPLPWQARFADQLHEIEWLIRVGAFHRPAA